MTASADDPGIPWVEFAEAPGPVVPPHRIIYSTQPQFARAEDGHEYFLKGPAPEVAFVEAAAHRLAALADLAVPPWGLGRVHGRDQAFFVSRSMRWRSDMDSFLSDVRMVANPGLLADVVAFDVWIANTDRNVNNIVAEPVSPASNPAKVKLFAIDFEKSQLLRGKGQVELATVEDRHCWPREDMARFCRTQAPPAECCARIAAISTAAVHAALAPLLLQLPCPATFDLNTATHALLSRAQGLGSLLRKEVWHGTGH